MFPFFGDAPPPGLTDTQQNLLQDFLDMAVGQPDVLGEALERWMPRWMTPPDGQQPPRQGATPTPGGAQAVGREEQAATATAATAATAGPAAASAGAAKRKPSTALRFMSYSLRASRSDVNHGEPVELVNISVERCCDHICVLDMNEDELLDLFLSTGAGLTPDDSADVDAPMAFVSTYVLPPRADDMERKRLEYDEGVECTTCDQERHVSIAVSWDAIETVAEWLDPLVGAELMPAFVFRDDVRITDPNDPYFRLARNLRLLAALMAASCSEVGNGDDENLVRFFFESVLPPSLVPLVSEEPPDARFVAEAKEVKPADNLI